MVIHLGSEILNCEVKWTLRRITENKASGNDGIPAEIFQILKDDTIKVLHSLLSTSLENSAVATGLEKISFHSNPKEVQCQRMFKLLYDCTHFSVSKAMLRILQVRQYMNQKLTGAQNLI